MFFIKHLQHIIAGYRDDFTRGAHIKNSKLRFNFPLDFFSSEKLTNMAGFVLTQRLIVNKGEYLDC